MQRRKSFLKRLESDTVYAIAISPFPYKSPLASRNVSLCRASRRPSPNDNDIVIINLVPSNTGLLSRNLSVSTKKPITLHKIA